MWVKAPIIATKSEQKITILIFFGNGWIQGICAIEGSETMDGNSRQLNW
jgi:hypothetical protein